MKQNNLNEFIKYCLVGGCATIVDWGIYTLLFLYVRLNYLVATGFGFVLGLITNFVLSKKFVFTQESKYEHEFTIYGVIGIIGLLFTSILMFVFVDILSVNALIARVVTTVIVLFWNYIARKMLY